MTKFRLYSDLHREFDGWEVPVIESEKDYIVILAGDIAVARESGTYVDFIINLCHRHKHVVYIPGNHEYYGSSTYTAWDNMKSHFEDIPNLHMLNQDSVVLDGVKIIGATLWTDFNDLDSGAMYMASQYMNDYHSIRKDLPNEFGHAPKITPEDTAAEHYMARQFIDRELETNQGEGLPILVVTHHGPTLQSVSPEFIGDTLNAAYVSDLSALIRERAPTAWVHGHVHSSHNYTEGSTRVFTNPKGYPHRYSSNRYENVLFVESGVLEELNDLFSVE